MVSKDRCLGTRRKKGKSSSKRKQNGTQKKQRLISLGNEAKLQLERNPCINHPSLERSHIHSLEVPPSFARLLPRQIREHHKDILLKRRLRVMPPALHLALLKTQ